MPPNIPGSCSPEGYGDLGIRVGINMPIPKVSQETWNSNKDSLSLSVLCMTSPASKQIHFPRSKAEFCLRQVWEAKIAFTHPWSLCAAPPHVSAAAFPGSKPQTGAAGEDSSCLAVQRNHGNHAGQLISFQRQHSAF